jgi:hypothetical protein
MLTALASVSGRSHCNVNATAARPHVASTRSSTRLAPDASRDALEQGELRWH